jgi:hypothetical protein
MKPGETPINSKRAAEILNLSRKTVYQLQYTGELKDIAHRFGPRLLYFYESELLDFMANRKYIPLKQVLADRKAAKVEAQ